LKAYVELNKNVKWPLFTSIATDRIEKERLSIPIGAFQFWKQKEFKEMLNEVMDKSTFDKFCHEEEESQGIAYMLLEMFKIRRTISVLNANTRIKQKNSSNSNGANLLLDTELSRSYVS